MKICRARPQLVFTFDNRFSSTGCAAQQSVRYIIFRLQASYLSATSHTGRKSCRVKSLYMKHFGADLLIDSQGWTAGKFRYPSANKYTLNTVHNNLHFLAKVLNTASKTVLHFLETVYTNLFQFSSSIHEIHTVHYK